MGCKVSRKIRLASWLVSVRLSVGKMTDGAEECVLKFPKGFFFFMADSEYIAVNRNNA